MAIFHHPIRVMFQHCDPARIVFYPRYFEMINATIETWFEQIAQYSFLTMFEKTDTGVPTASIETRFHRPSRLGDQLVFALEATRLGRISITFDIGAKCGDEKRMSVVTTLVHIDGKSGRPDPWSDAVRTNIQKFMEKE